MKTNKLLLLLSASAFLFLISGGLAAADDIFGGGDGSVSSPYLIDNATGFDAIRNDLSAHYKLNANIDFTGVVGFVPIGKEPDPFLGSLTGGAYENGTPYTISNFEYSDPSGYGIGLFGYAKDAEFSDLVLENIKITGDYRAGALVGQIVNTTVTNCYVNSSNLISGQSGLIGHADNSTISDCLAVNVNHSGSSSVGGILGHGTNTTITDCHSDGKVEAKQHVGGIVGSLSYGSIDRSNSSCTINVNMSYLTSPASSHYIGGLAGYIEFSNINNSHFSGSIDSVGQFTGGLVGCGDQSNITDSYVVGDVKSTELYTGGLIGTFRVGNITNSYAEGTINGTENVGGLVGYSEQVNLKGSYVNNNIINGTKYVGGLVGDVSNSTISGSFMAGDVEGSSTTSYYVGGLAGIADSDSEISDCYVTGDVEGYEYVGGLIGSQSNAVQNCLALNEYVNGTTSVGRLYGHSGADRTIDSFAWENISNGGTAFTDGGNNGATITSAKVWCIYPDSGWENWSSNSLWKLNQHNEFLLPVHSWKDENVIANAAHLISEYYITYDGNTYTSGTVPVDSAAYDVNFETVTILGAGDMKKENHTFAGWNTEADGSGVSYAADSTW